MPTIVSKGNPVGRLGAADFPAGGVGGRTEAPHRGHSIGFLIAKYALQL
jgi:hypothetical protein